MDEDSIPQDSVIILTTEDVDSLNLEDNRQIMVNAVSWNKYLLNQQIHSLIITNPMKLITQYHLIYFRMLNQSSFPVP